MSRTGRSGGSPVPQGSCSRPQISSPMCRPNSSPYGADSKYRLYLYNSSLDLYISSLYLYNSRLYLYNSRLEIEPSPVLGESATLAALSGSRQDTHESLPDPVVLTKRYADMGMSEGAKYL